MKPVLAWAVVEKNGTLACYDYRLPITWMRRFAAQENKERVDGHVIRVEIREFVPTKKKKRK